MRERNKKYLNNIGNLIEEIKNQDLEEINGGKDNLYLSIVTRVNIGGQCGDIQDPVTKGSPAIGPCISPIPEVTMGRECLPNITAEILCK